MFKINEAISLNNGIYFCSSSKSNIGVYCYVDTNGKIKTERCSFSASETIKQNIYSIPKDNYSIFIIVNLFLALLACISFNFFTHSPVALSLLILFLLNSSPKSYILYLCFFEAHCKKNTKKVYRFHSAEHMVVNYFNKNQKLPTIDEITYDYMFEENCNFYLNIFLLVSKTLFWIISVLLIFNFNTFSILWIPTIFSISFWGTFLLDRFKILKYLEIIYLKMPTKEELEIALIGLSELINMEKTTVEL